MDNPGDYPLFVGPITTALDRSTGAQDWIDIDLSGVTAITLKARLAYGSGGAVWSASGSLITGGCSAIVQTASSVDRSMVYDIARFDFGQATRSATANLEGLLSRTVTDYAQLDAEGVNDGLLMNSYRVVLLVGSTPYLNTTLSLIGAFR